MEQKDIGLLLREKNIKLQRHYFKETVKLIGIQCIYRAPIENKTWDGWGELTAYYQPPQIVGCLFFEHPDQKTLKKKGWVAELQENSSLIEVPYDLKDLEVGALFIIPSGLDDAKGRVFKVISMQNIAVFPVSITCEIAPVYESTFDRQQMQHEDNNMNILLEDDKSNFRLLKEDSPYNSEED